MASSADLRKVVKDMEIKGQIQVLRKPQLSKMGKKTTFLTENKAQKVFVRIPI